MAEPFNALVREPEPVKPSPAPWEETEEKVALLGERLDHVEFTLALLSGSRAGEGLFSRILRKMGLK